MTGQVIMKTFPLKMTPEFNQQLRMIAAQKDVSIQSFIMQAIETQLKKEVKK